MLRVGVPCTSVTVDELVREVRKDCTYYETSGGGVTASGGEPLMQAEFVAEFLARQGFGADWRQAGSHQWVMRELTIEYRLATSFGDQMEAMVWLAQAGNELARFGCQLNHLCDGQRQAAVAVEVPHPDRPAKEMQQEDEFLEYVFDIRNTIESLEASNRAGDD